MPHEIEVKFRIAPPDELRQRLRTAGARLVRSEFEENQIFDTPERRLLAAGSALRIRIARALDASGAMQAIITFKGPRDAALAASGIRAREELETTIADGGTAVAIVERLGYRPVLGYEKRRETWELHDCEVTLDELPRLGWFVEIEGPAAASIAARQAELRLADALRTAETYVELTARHGTADSAGVVRLTFPR